MWAECLRVLKPGGHLLSFGGTRTYHRMASAIEDAGFEIRDMIEWVYGSGFPKSLNIGKAVDKLQGNEREITGTRIKKAGDMTSGNFKRGGDYPDKELTDTKGTSEWEGWGTALKPAHEPICMARKPLAEKSVAENCLKWGTGGINIDESRVGTDGGTTKGTFPNEVSKGIYGNGLNGACEIKDIGMGRFPANLIHDGSDEVVSGFPNNTHRFFYTPKASKSERNRGIEDLPLKISGGMQGTQDKSLKTGSGNERNNLNQNFHPTVKPVALMEYLVKMVTLKGGVVLDPFMGSGSTGVACKNLGRKFIGIEQEPEYVHIAKKRIDDVQPQLSIL